jgi:CRP-like cAMP-binding protein
MLIQYAKSLIFTLQYSCFLILISPIKGCIEIMESLSELFTTVGQQISMLQLNPTKDNFPKLVWVKKGIAKIFAINDSGCKVNTDLIFEGELFLYSKDNYQCQDMFFLEILKYSEMYSIPLSYLKASQLYGLSEKLMHCYNQRLQRIHQQKVKNYDFKLVDRLFYLLADFCRIYGHRSGDYYVIPNYFTHEDLASMLKTCRQNITSSLCELKRAGLLYYNRKEIRFEKDVFENSRANQHSGFIENKVLSIC